jgi:hypothetical protein
MIYLIKIGNRTRKGNFQELQSRTVQARDSISIPVIKNHYQKQYQGFEIIVSKIEQLPDDLDTEIKQEGQDGFITDIPVTYTTDEQEIADQLFQKQDEARKLLNELHSKIEQRYKMLRFTNIGYRKPIEIESSGEMTWIRRLPIFGAAFIKALSEGEQL